MSKKPYHTPAIKTREAHPIPKRGKEHIALMCPFCSPTHPLVPGKPSTCGTSLRVMAVQTIVSARTARIEGLTCVKCGQKAGGEMVKYFNGYIHLQECAPEIQLLTSIPAYSKWAKWVYKLPESLREKIEKWTGVVQIVHGLTPDGEDTGEIEGYFFAPPYGGGVARPAKPKEVRV